MPPISYHDGSTAGGGNAIGYGVVNAIPLLFVRNLIYIHVLLELKL
jgi:hypothetical protein